MRIKILIPAFAIASAVSLAGCTVPDTGLVFIEDSDEVSDEISSDKSNDIVYDRNVPVLDLAEGFDPESEGNDDGKLTAMSEFASWIWDNSNLYSATIQSMYELGWLPVYDFAKTGEDEYQIELFANYPIITQDEAYELLRDGQYLNEMDDFTPTWEELQELEVDPQEFKYCYSSDQQYIMPYYYFVPLYDDGSEYTYGCYVPAIAPEYLSGRAEKGEIVSD